MTGEERFKSLIDQLELANEDVIKGKMMSSDGLKVNNKVFTFFHKGQMGFRLNPKFDTKAYGLNHAKPLSPFKTKPPLKGWFMVADNEADKWPELAEMALEFTRMLK